MRKMRSIVVVAVATLLYCTSLSAATAKDEAVKSGSTAKIKDEAVKTSPAQKVVDGAATVNKATKAIKEIAAIPKKKIPPVLVNEASAIVLVPGAAKRDFMVSGAKSRGVLLVHDKDGNWSSPVFITLSGGTLGWQIVADPMDIVLVFKDRKFVDAILKGKFTMDAKTATEIGRLGLTMKGATAKELKAEISTYVRSHGAFFDDSPVAGSTLQIDAAANDTFYGQPKVDAGEIVSGKVLKSSEDVKALQKLLADYAAKK